MNTLSKLINSLNLFLLLGLFMSQDLHSAKDYDNYFTQNISLSFISPKFDLTGINKLNSQVGYPLFKSPEFYGLEIGAFFKGTISFLNSKDGSSFTKVGIGYMFTANSPIFSYPQNKLHYFQTSAESKAIKLYMGYQWNIFESLSFFPYITFGVGSANFTYNDNINKTQNINDFFTNDVISKLVSQSNSFIGFGAAARIRFKIDDEIRDTTYKFDSCTCFNRFQITEKDYISIDFGISYLIRINESISLGGNKIGAVKFNYPNGLIITTSITWETFYGYKKVEVGT